MAKARVTILYEPLIYADLLRGIFEELGTIEVTRAVDQTADPFDEGLSPEEAVDVIFLPLDEEGKPRIEILPEPQPRAKLLAFSPDGKRGLRRMPGESSWQELRPFGLADLMFEVLSCV